MAPLCFVLPDRYRYGSIFESDLHSSHSLHSFSKNGGSAVETPPPVKEKGLPTVGLSERGQDAPEEKLLALR